MKQLRGNTVLAIVVLLAGCATAAQQADLSTDATIIDLPRPVHFQTVDGTDRTLEAGAYRVDRTSTEGLSVKDLESPRTMTLKAEAVTHDFDLRGPLALAVPQGEDARHIVLLLPGGQAFDAAGSVSGIQSRATASTTVSRMTLQQGVQMLPQTSLAQLVMAPLDPCAEAIPPPPTPPATLATIATAQSNMRTSGRFNKQVVGQSAVAQEFGPDPIPDVVDWQPKQKIPAGKDLRIQGRNLDPARFVVKIGETALPSTSQTSLEMKYAIPTWLRAFNTPLVVYHRGGTPRTLEMNYEVFDPSPKITRVAPETFSQGDLVTLCGVSMSHLTLIQSVLTDIVNGVRRYEIRKLVLIGQPNGQYQNYHYVEMMNPISSPSGDRLTFVADKLYREQFRANDATNTGAYTDIVPNPTPPPSVTGPLTFHSETNPTTSRDVFAPNPVAWRLGGPKIVKLGVNPHASGFGLNEPFVILAPVLSNNTTFPRLAQLRVEGFNLNGPYRIGNVPLSGGFSGGGLPPDETLGLLSVPATATSGQVCGTKNGITNCWPYPFTVVPGPVMAGLPWQLPAPTSVPAFYNLQGPTLPLAIRTLHTINGLHLTPSAVPGLTYELHLPGLMVPAQQIAGGSTPTFEQCNVVFTVIEHTASRIQFRIGDPARPVPSATCMTFLATYFNSGSQTPPYLRLVAKYQGKQSDLSYFKVYLTQ